MERARAAATDNDGNTLERLLNDDVAKLKVFMEDSENKFVNLAGYVDEINLRRKCLSNIEETIMDCVSNILVDEAGGNDCDIIARCVRTLKECEDHCRILF